MLIHLVEVSSLFEPVRGGLDLISFGRGIPFIVCGYGKGYCLMSLGWLIMLGIFGDKQQQRESEREREDRC